MEERRRRNLDDRNPGGQGWQLVLPATVRRRPALRPGQNTQYRRDYSLVAHSNFLGQRRRPSGRRCADHRQCDRTDQGLSPSGRCRVGLYRQQYGKQKTVGQHQRERANLYASFSTPFEIPEENKERNGNSASPARERHVTWKTPWNCWTSPANGISIAGRACFPTGPGPART